MHDDNLVAVRDMPLFASMSDEHFDNLIQDAQLQRFPAHDHLITEGEPANFLHILVQGTVELFGSSNDRETTMFVLRPVSTYNVSAVLEDAVYLASARTLSEADILMIPAENLRNVMAVDAAFAHAMVTELAVRYRMVIRAFKEQRLRSGVEKLANYLLRANEQAGKGGRIILTEDKRKLAALLGMTPEYLSRAFTALREYGVEVKGSKINLKNLDALTHIAKPNPLIDRHEI